MFANTPAPPYVAVIFTNTRTAVDEQGYGQMAARMEELASQQEGYLGSEHLSDPSGLNCTISYWRDEAAARAWKQDAEHLGAQKLGREKWYQQFKLRVATVTRDYSFERG